MSWCCVLGAPALLVQALVALAATMSALASLKAVVPTRVSAMASPEDKQPRLPETTSSFASLKGHNGLFPLPHLDN